MYLKSQNGGSLIDPLHYDHRTSPPTSTNFQFLSEIDAKKLIKSVPTKSCELHPIPTTILKECIGAILKECIGTWVAIITTIVN